jgi:hypothetical protein
MAVKDGEVPKAIIPGSPFAKTEQPAHATNLSPSASLMSLGGELFEEFFHSIAEQLEANSGLSEEQNAEIATYLQTNNREIVAKRDRLGEFLARLDSEAEAIRNEELRLAARRNGYEKIASCMRSSIHTQMLDSGVKKAEGKLFSFSVRKNPPRVEITDEAAVPPEYVDYVTKINRAGIKDALESGKEVAGAELVQTTRLEIR